jgi:translocation protein SEC63
VGDHKLNRVFVHPQRITDVGSTRVRTVRHKFQAPPNPGLYTVQMYIKSDSYLDTDLQKGMKVSRDSYDSVTDQDVFS